MVKKASNKGSNKGDQIKGTRTFFLTGLIQSISVGSMPRQALPRSHGWLDKWISIYSRS
jgi:hypothetical protein